MMTRYIINGLDKRLREAVADSNMTIVDIARKSGVRRDYIWNYLMNYRTPGVYQLFQLAKVLNVSMDWLLGMKEDKR